MMVYVLEWSGMLTLIGALLASTIFELRDAFLELVLGRFPQCSTLEGL